MLKQVVLHAREEDGLLQTQHIDYIYEQLESHIRETASGPKEQEPGVRRIRHKGKGRRVREQCIHARTQDMFKNNPGELAKYVRNNMNWQVQTIAQLHEVVSSLVHDLWGKVHEIRQPFTGEPEEPDIIGLNELIPYISKKEISSRVAHLKRDMAAEPDKISRKHVTRSDIQEALRLLLHAAGNPAPGNGNRATLILKKGKDPTKAENYRPVMIGSLVSQLYWGIIDQKLRVT